MLLGLEQLGVCRELLLDGSPVKARMALILLDGLADSLIHRRLQNLYETSEQRFAMGPRLYSTKERKQARKNFGERVEFAQHGFLPGGLVWDEGPILDELDAAIVRVGHSYRADAHHRDTHNPAVIGPLGRVVFGAVARTLTRSQPTGLYVGHSSAMREELAAVRDRGRARPRADATGRCRRGCRPHARGPRDRRDGARGRARRRPRGAPDQAVEGAGFLPLDRGDLSEALARYELWIKHSADEDFIELLRLMDPAARAYLEKLESVPELYLRQAEQAERDLQGRIVEIERVERPTANVDLIDTSRGVAGRLRHETELARLLTDYHDADRALRVLEECLQMGVEEWDRRLQLEEDLRRGSRAARRVEDKLVIEKEHRPVLRAVPTFLYAIANRGAGGSSASSSCCAITIMEPASSADLREVPSCPIGRKVLEARSFGACSLTASASALSISATLYAGWSRGGYFWRLPMKSVSRLWRLMIEHPPCRLLVRPRLVTAGLYKSCERLGQPLSAEAVRYAKGVCSRPWRGQANRGSRALCRVGATARHRIRPG